MEDGDIDAVTVRTRVLEQLASLPGAEHLAALRAIDLGDVDIDPTDPGTIGSPWPPGGTSGCRRPVADGTPPPSVDG